ncbi:MAG: helix-turn-helix domain-containing protein [Lachnospiraceae bacterium]|nr:helix-turn-helix domain-containing protein [Lachnospiraceae bacterium]
MNETLSFFLHILENMRIPAAIMKPPYGNAHLFDFGAHKIALPTLDYTKYASRFFATCLPRTIYRAVDDLSFSYFILMLSGTEPETSPETMDEGILPSSPSFLVIGPYSLEPFHETDILNTAAKYSIPPESYPAFLTCYEKIPVIRDSSTLLTLVNSFASTIWGSMEAFTLKDLTTLPEKSDYTDFNTDFSSTGAEDLLLSMKNIESRYAAETELLRMVSQGQIHKVDMYLNLIDFAGTEQRHVDKVRNAKNYAIILNTLLRKTAEQNAVHPIHIDKLSSSLAKKIELQASEVQVSQLLKEMVRKYTLLIKNRSLKGYSPLIRTVMTHIDNDLAADLSLGALASVVGYNASYLSSLFKKETGYTLTEYVSRKRMEQAVFLLNATQMQVQTIASYCGVPDVCYFTKIFKKIIGKTPTEYRNEILNK